MVLLFRTSIQTSPAKKRCAWGSEPTAVKWQIPLGFAFLSVRSLGSDSRTPIDPCSNRQIILIPCSRMRFQPGQSQSDM